MQKFILFLLSASPFIQQCYAQSNYMSGYVVALDGDTIQGLINYERWDRNPRKVAFKPNAGPDILIYYPTQVKSFSVAGEIYEGGIVDIDISPVKVRDLDESPFPSYVKDSVFLQSLIGGEKSLLLLKDENGKVHFFIKENEEYPPLLYKQYARRTDTSSKVIVENTGYKGRLALYLKDCPDIQHELRNITYTQTALTKLFGYYYKCTNSNVRYSGQRSDGSFEVGVLAGVSMTKLDFQGPVKYLTDINYDVSNNAVVGVFLNVKLLRTNGWRVSNDLLFTTFEVKGQSEFEDFPDYTAYSSFKYSYLKTHHALQISLLDQGRLYLAAGFSTGVAMQKKADVLLVYSTGTNTVPEFKSRNYEFGYLGGLGFRAGRWNAEVRFEQTTGISNYLSEGSNLTRGYFFARYTFFSQK